RRLRQTTPLSITDTLHPVHSDWRRDFPGTKASARPETGSPAQSDWPVTTLQKKRGTPLRIHRAESSAGLPILPVRRNSPQRTRFFSVPPPRAEVKKRFLSSRLIRPGWSSKSGGRENVPPAESAIAFPVRRP